MDIQRFEIENITKSGFACVRDILTDRLLVTSDSCDILNEQYQRILDLQSQLDQQKAMWQKLKEFIKTYQEDVVWKNKQVDEFQEEILDKMQELEEEDVKD